MFYKHKKRSKTDICVRNLVNNVKQLLYKETKVQFELQFATSSEIENKSILRTIEREEDRYIDIYVDRSVCCCCLKFLAR